MLDCKLTSVYLGTIEFLELTILNNNSLFSLRILLASKTLNSADPEDSYLTLHPAIMKLHYFKVVCAKIAVSILILR